MLASLTNGLNALSHGWSGLVFGYATVQGPMLTALVRSRAQLRKLLWSPVMAIPGNSARRCRDFGSFNLCCGVSESPMVA